MTNPTPAPDAGHAAELVRMTDEALIERFGKLSAAMALTGKRHRAVLETERDAIHAEILRRMAQHTAPARTGEGEPKPEPTVTYRYDAASNRTRKLVNGIPQDD